MGEEDARAQAEAAAEMWEGADPATVALFGILAVALGFALYFARSVALPVALAGLASLVLAPLVRALQRLRIPPSLSAALLLVALFAGTGYALVSLTGPAAEWLQRAPASAREVEHKLRFLRDPVAKMSQATAEVEKATQLGSEPDRSVVVRAQSLADVVLDQTQGFAVGFLMTMVLLYFILSSPDDLLEKLVELAPRLRDKKRVVAAVREIESEVSHYLLTISMINAGYGAVVGAALWLLGVPNAALWGVLAGLTNFVPYAGAFSMAVVLAAVGILTFSDPTHMFLPWAVFVGLNAIESNLVTPMLVSRRLTLSPVVVFVWVLVWSWLWGVPGGLIAVPLLAAAKIAMQHIPPVAPLRAADGLSGRSAGADAPPIRCSRAARRGAAGCGIGIPISHSTIQPAAPACRLRLALQRSI